MDEHRAWGWQVVNYVKYRSIRDEDDRREQNRIAQANWRAKKSDSKQSKPESSEGKQGKPRKPESAHTDVDVDVEAKKAKAIAPPAAPALPAGPPFITIPLNDGSEYPVAEKQVTEFEALYPSADVKQTLRNIKGWCIANPTKRKTKAGVLRFLTSWLAKVQDSGRSKAASSGAGTIPEFMRGGI